MYILHSWGCERDLVFHWRDDDGAVTETLFTKTQYRIRQWEVSVFEFSTEKHFICLSRERGVEFDTTRILMGKIPIQYPRKYQEENEDDDSKDSRTHIWFAIPLIIEKIREIQFSFLRTDPVFLSALIYSTAHTMLAQLIATFQKRWPTIPHLLDEESILECIRAFSNIHMASLDEYRDVLPDNIFIYEKWEERKSLGVEDIRRCIGDISLRPYSWKALYILRNFDDASPEAMNACLKLFEEPPEYAIILLWVENPEKLLETIRSRTIHHPRKTIDNQLPDTVRTYIREYFEGSQDGLIQYLYATQHDTLTALTILRESMYYAPWDLLLSIETAIIEIYQVHENPRNILDRVFLCR